MALVEIDQTPTEVAVGLSTPYADVMVGAGRCSCSWAFETGSYENEHLREPTISDLY